MNMPHEEPKRRRLVDSSGHSLRPRRRRRRRHRRRSRTDWRWILVVAALAILAFVIGSTDLLSDDPGQRASEEKDDD
jgi:hypothetical protein